MTRKTLLGICGISVFGACFVGFPVFASDTADITIVEVVDEGSGTFKPWEDIVGAMPGTTYSAIPRVANNGSVPVSVRMCSSESAFNSLNEPITMPTNVFGFNIDSNWTMNNEEMTNALGPVLGNCYVYNSVLEAGAVTQPLFTEVTLSSELGNEYENSTFNLHLYAEAIGDYPITQTPAEPDTGVNSASYFEVVSPVVFATGGLALIGGLFYIIKRLMRKS